MATQILSRYFLSKPTTIFIFSRSLSSFSTTTNTNCSFSLLRALRPLTAAVSVNRVAPPVVTARTFATRATTSSLNDPSPNWSNRPPKETILLDGCDFEHWLVVMETPEGDPTRDDIIDSYIKTLAMVVGSEEEARKKIYSVSTRCYYAFGALVSEELSYKLKELPRVRWVLPDSYLDVKNKDYGGEPFIDGKAVPYDPKYHEEWIRNNARANERNRRNDRPRNFDRSRNFERRRENMQNRDFQNRAAPSMANQGVQSTAPNMGGPGAAPPANNYGPPPLPPNNYRPPPPPPSNYGQPPPPPNNYGQPPPPPPPSNNYGQPPPPNNYGPPPPPSNNYGQPPPNSYMGGPQNMGGTPPNAGWSRNVPGNMQQNYQSSPNNGGMPYQGASPNYPNNYTTPNRDGSLPGGNPNSA